MKKIGAITIGQAPRVDVTADILPLFEGRLQLLEAGALDGLNEKELRELEPEEGDYVLVSRLKDGGFVRLAKRKILPKLHQAASRLVAEGAEAILVLCTGEFGNDLHADVTLLHPDHLLSAFVPVLSQNILVLTPDEAQCAQSQKRWESLVKQVHVVVVNPYAELATLKNFLPEIQASKADLVVPDCIGYTQEMRKILQQETGKQVLLPRTLMVRVACELLL